MPSKKRKKSKKKKKCRCVHCSFARSYKLAELEDYLKQVPGMTGYMIEKLQPRMSRMIGDFPTISFENARRALQSKPN